MAQTGFGGTLKNLGMGSGSGRGKRDMHDACRPVVDAEKCIGFGWASGALVTTLLTDYGEPADEDVVWSIYSGNARVKR